MNNEFKDRVNDYGTVVIEERGLKVVACYNRREFKWRFRRFYYAVFLDNNGIKVSKDNIDAFLTKIEENPSEFMENGVDILKGIKMVQEATDSAVRHYDLFKEAMEDAIENFFFECYFRGIMDGFNKYEAEAPTQCQTFASFAKCIIASIRDRMRIITTRGNRQKHSNEKKLDMCREFKILKADLEMAKDTMHSLEKLKEKNKNLRTKEEWEAYEKKQMEPYSHIHPDLLEDLDSGLPGNSPYELALEVIYKKYNISSATNCASLIKSVEPAFQKLLLENQISE